MTDPRLDQQPRTTGLVETAARLLKTFFIVDITLHVYSKIQITPTTVFKQLNF